MGGTHLSRRSKHMSCGDLIKWLSVCGCRMQGNLHTGRSKWSSNTYRFFNNSIQVCYRNTNHLSVISTYFCICSPSLGILIWFYLYVDYLGCKIIAKNKSKLTIYEAKDLLVGCKHSDGVQLSQYLIFMSWCGG